MENCLSGRRGKVIVLASLDTGAQNSRILVQEIPYFALHAMKVLADRLAKMRQKLLWLGVKPLL